MNTQDLLREFDRQVENLRKKDYLEDTTISPEDFLNAIESLQVKVETLPLLEIDMEKGKLPFVLVVRSTILSAEEMMKRAKKDKKQGVTILRPHTSRQFTVIDDVTIPERALYLLVDIDRGKENINLPPSEAMSLIQNAGRSPLTIDEGIAIITQFPEFLRKNNCFSLLASRTGTDKRVPAIWINANKEPNLGWCWEGNPHTWLGSASCLTRIG